MVNQSIQEMEITINCKCGNKIKRSLSVFIDEITCKECNRIYERHFNPYWEAYEWNMKKEIKSDRS